MLSQPSTGPATASKPLGEVLKPSKAIQDAIKDTLQFALSRLTHRAFRKEASADAGS